MRPVAHKHRQSISVAVVLSALVTVPVADAQTIVAHRGAAHEAPENTLAAFNLAWDKGADAIEGDFYLTRDGHIVAIHDETTQRTAGVDLPVASTTLAELRRLDVGAWKSDRYRGQRIPTLQEVLATIPDGKKFFIEIKCGPEIIPRLREVLATSSLKPEQTVIICFNKEVIAAAKKHIPHIKAYWLTDFKQDKSTGKWSPTLQQVLTTLRQIHADGLDSQANSSVVDQTFVRGLRAAGMEFHVWTINDPLPAARYQRLGVDSITTDRPAVLRQNLPARDLHKHIQIHLKLNGNLKDASRFGRHARLSSGHREKLSFVKGVFGKALDLQKGHTSVAVPYQLPETGSLCLWYFARTWYDHQTVFDNSIHENSWEMWIDASGLLRFHNDPSGITLNHPFHPTADVSEWHHLAITWNRHDNSNKAVHLFVNGHLSLSAGWENHPWIQPGPTVHLGDGYRDNDRGNGMWDELLIFDKLLKQADIRAIMNLSAASPAIR